MNFSLSDILPRTPFQEKQNKTKTSSIAHPSLELYENRTVGFFFLFFFFFLFLKTSLSLYLGVGTKVVRVKDEGRCSSLGPFVMATVRREVVAG